MRVDVLPAAALSVHDLALWSELQLADPGLASPFFRPEFTQAVATVRSDVVVGVLRDGDRAQGFFPFQRGALGCAGPVGGRMSDYQGVIAVRGLEWDPAWLVRACGLRAWDFNNLVASQRPFRAHHSGVTPSPYLDLSRGFEDYRRARAAHGSQVIAQADRKARKLAREVGPVRFEAQDRDPAALRQLLAWKADQYRRSGAPNAFAARWRVALFERLLAHPMAAFAGVLSTLRAGDALVAAHLGIRSRDAWHWWFPAYDPAFARFSPGVTLLLELARHAAENGVGALELGSGDEPYKRRFASAAVMLAQGSVVSSPAVAVGRRLGHGLKHAVRATPLAPRARAASRRLRRALDERGATVVEGASR